jgi:serine/threonine protein kinase/formylglycine-generating enzyme required for sulfatase activity/pimeloyl-ACP methyl ester carboxylesterase
MKRERWEDIDRLYHAALEREPAARASFLDEACAGDDELRLEVATLLASDEQAGSFLATPAVEIAARKLAAEPLPEFQTGKQPDPPAPRRIGAYQLLDPLGRGGMGEVHLAFDTRLGRKVAIKLLPVEFTAQPERVRRFEQEARAASALNHPNIITIHEIGEAPKEDGNRRYIVTEYVEGETLRQRMTDSPQRQIAVSEAIDVASQIAAALSAAHGAGIVHRDIKPENVMVRRDRLVKVLDFGLAKLTESPTPGLGSRDSTLIKDSTASGVVMGTPRYMAPEQARGHKVDTRTDIFSLGVMLYEMIAGRPPFAGETPGEMIAAILRDEPPPLGRHAPEAPPELERILSKALRKNRDERYQTVDELSADLKKMKRRLERQNEFEDELIQAGQQSAEVRASTIGGNGSPPDTTVNQAASTGDIAPAQATSKYWLDAVRPPKLIAFCALSLVVAVAGWLYWRNTRSNKAKALVPRIEELAQAERYFEAYDLAIEAQGYLTNDTTLTRLMRTIADDLSVVTDPPGAQVYLTRFNPYESGSAEARPSRQLIGMTPINHRQIARGAYVVSIEKEGYAGLERSVTGLLMHMSGVLAPSFPIGLDAKLIELAKAPARMAFVPAGDYRLSSWGRPTDKSVKLNDFFVDKYEVTNREYKEFITAGGYLRREFWRYPIIKDRRELAWEEAIREFKDRTSVPGPRSWANQDFPEGKAEHPVTDISWYEAAAYAAFRGKDLPTIFQWEKAARGDLGGPYGGRAAYYIMPWGPFTGTIEGRANFSGRGTLPVESMEFGLSPFGCYHMAGNVAEWCRNVSPEGFTTAGGSWDEAPYLFGYYGAYPGIFSSGKLGFRCVLNTPEAAGDQGGASLLAKAEVQVYTPVSEARFLTWQGHYGYAQPSLDAEVIERKESDDWRREKITFVAAEGERAIAYLYLPKRYPPPWQVIQYMPGGDVFGGARSISARVEASLAPFIKSGRAVLAVVLKGFSERAWPSNYSLPPIETIEYSDLIKNWMTDERRGLDYAVTRNDLDAGRIAYYAVSPNGLSLCLPAIDTRYRSVILIGAGLHQSFAYALPEVNPFNLLPYIHAPKLLLHGRYDENVPLKSNAEPMQKLLRGQKRIVIYDGGHTPPLEIYVPPINNWLDETLGPVRRN